MNEERNSASESKLQKRPWIIISLAMIAVLAFAIFIVVIGSQPDLRISYQGRTTNAAGEVVWMFKTENTSKKPLWVYNSIIAETADGWGDDSPSYFGSHATAIPAGGYHTVPIKPPSGGRISATQRWRYSAWYVDERGKIADLVKLLIHKLTTLSSPTSVQGRFQAHVEKPMEFRTFMGPIIDPANLPPENPEP